MELNTKNWVTLYNFNSFEEALLAQSYLQAAGIETILIDERKEFSNPLNQWNHNLELQVPLANANEAHRLLLSAGHIVEPENDVYFGPEILSLKNRIRNSPLPNIAIGLFLVLLILVCIALFFD